jgi:hypothetical protein
MRLFLAPHHDDVLLSLSGLLLDGRGSAGEDHVAVVFSRETRELEDVCTREHRGLGLGLHLLGFEEALRRGVTLRDCLRPTRTLERGGDDDLADSIRARLSPLVSRLEPSAVYSPLLPVHLDHALVRVAAEGLGAPLAYYEDQPYACLYPDALKRETAGLLRQEAESRASVEEATALLCNLRGALPEQHLKRIIHGYGKAGRITHNLWTSP